jgi:hypothetical protein
MYVFFIKKITLTQGVYRYLDTHTTRVSTSVSLNISQLLSFQDSFCMFGLLKDAKYPF